MDLEPVNLEKWSERIGPTGPLYTSNSGGALKVSVSQKQRIASAIQFNVWADGPWRFEAEVNGETQ